MAAATLADRLDVSQPTIYRRLQELKHCKLVSEQTEPDPDAGHHRKVYQATLDHIQFELTDGGVELHISRREPMADAFTRLVEGL